MRQYPRAHGGLLSAMIVTALVLSPQIAWASWAAVPLGVLIDQADLIVAGKVTAVKDAGFMVGNRKQDVAVIEVKRIYKTLGHVGRPREIRLVQPARGGIALSTDIRYRVGQEGIWLVSHNAEKKVFQAGHPSQFQAAGKAQEVAKLVKARENLKGGKAVDGLVARAEVATNQFPRGPASYELRVSLQNVSTKPISICLYVGNKPLGIDWTGPNGPEKIDPYLWLRRARLAGVRKEDFVTLMPGAILYVGPRGRSQGSIYFQKAGPQGGRNVNAAAAGNHTLAIRFSSKETGQKFGLKAWTGTIAANPATFTVK